MHRDQLTFVLLTPLTDFLVTASADGVVKFWKKISGTIEFVKEFKAHKDEIKSMSVSADGRSLVTAGADRTVKIFDVVTFDLLSMLDLEFTPACVCWVHKRGAPIPLLAVSAVESHNIHIFDGRGGNQQPLRTLKSVHRASVTSMAFNNVYDCVVSADEGGMIEYWSPGSNYEKPETVFSMKSGTNLFEFKKVRVHMSNCLGFLLTRCRPSQRQRPSLSLPLANDSLRFPFLTGRSDCSNSHPENSCARMMNLFKP